MASRSGGFFSILSDFILEQSGVVYGCALDDSFQAIHIRAVTQEQRDRCRESKYVQSNLMDTYKWVLNDLKHGKKVLFSGTPCQVAALRNFCRGFDKNLLCVDIICHGVPSPMVWKDYLDFCERRYRGKVTTVDFINKRKFGWAAHHETITVNNQSYDSTIYTHLFGRHNILRPACFECPYKNLTRPGDITIGDAWGIQDANPEMDDNRGVSLVLVNTEVGRCVFDVVRKECEWKEVSIENYLQRPLISAYSEPPERAEFWAYYFSHSFEKVIRKYIEPNVFVKAIRKVKKIVFKR